VKAKIFWYVEDVSIFLVKLFSNVSGFNFSIINLIKKIIKNKNATITIMFTATVASFELNIFKIIIVSFILLRILTYYFILSPIVKTSF